MEKQFSLQPTKTVKRGFAVKPNGHGKFKLKPFKTVKRGFALKPRGKNLHLLTVKQLKQKLQQRGKRVTKTVNGKRVSLTRPELLKRLRK